jgi:uncharacterized membrane protein YhaH (DUF805 family)
MDISTLLFSFEGRIRRLHYWLVSIGVGAVASVIGGVLFSFSGMIVMTAAGPIWHAPNPIAGVLLLALYAAEIWIGLALGAKRCHDRDKSAWFLLISLIPFLGALWLLIELGFLDGTPGPNKYGPSPKGLGGPSLAVA